MVTNVLTPAALTPPSFVEGMTPDDLLEWGRKEDSSKIINDMLSLYEESTVVDMLLVRYSRYRLVALLSGSDAPANEEQEVFLAAAREGQPISLLSVGNEHLAKQGFQPTLRKVKDGDWQWQVGGYTGEKATLWAALYECMTIANRIIG